MKENLVTSLELSRELKENGYPQDSEFYWVKNRQTAFPDIRILAKGILEEHNENEAPAFQFETFCAAPTAGELGEMLPAGRYEIIKDDAHRFAIWGKEEGFSASTEADARAKMWIYLKKNNLIRATAQ